MREGNPRETVRRTAGRARRTAAKAAEAARETVEEYADDTRGRVHATYDQAAEWAADAYDRGEKRYRRARKASEEAFHTASDNLQNLVEERPYVVGLAGLAAGFILGALVTRTCSSSRRDDWDDEDR